MSLNFDWDESKNISNFKKHQIWFDEAQTIWTDSGSLEFYDIDHSDSEDRYIRIGYSTKNRILMVVYCEPEHQVPFELLALERQLQRSVKNMRKEYDLKSLKKRPGAVKVDPDAAKVPTSIRLDGSVVADLKTEALRLGLPYQTLISSILYRYTQGDLVDKKALDIEKLLKTG